MTPEERKNPTPEEDFAAFLADLEEIAAHAAQQGDKRMNFENYRPAPGVAPGFYHFPERAMKKLFLPELLQRDFEAPEPFAHPDDRGGYFVMLKPELKLSRHTGDRPNAPLARLFELGDGGFVNLSVTPDAPLGECVEAFVYAEYGRACEDWLELFICASKAERLHGTKQEKRVTSSASCSGH